MKVAIVHDDLMQWGGAEELVSDIHQIWPQAPLFTSFASEKIIKNLKQWEIKTSFMQKLPFKNLINRGYLPFFPFAFESFSFDDYEVVISQTTRFAHGIITKPQTLHICYCDAVPRFLWESTNYLHENNIPSIFKPFLPFVLSWLRLWDQVAANRPDLWIANSKNVALKIKKYYGKDSTVIYPGVDIENFSTKKEKNQENYLIVTRLVSWKRVDIAIKAANNLKLSLKVVGEGPQRRALEKFAGPTVRFLGKVKEEELRKIYAQSKALIVTQEEDFGLAIVEAQAAGTAVLALGKGGAREIILEGKTGEFFKEQQEESLSKALRNFDPTKYLREACNTNAHRFSKEIFENKLKNFVEQSYREFQKS